MNRECRLTDRLVVTAKPDTHEYSVRDTGCKGLALRVQPTGARTWILRGLAADPRQRHSLGDADSLTVTDARRIAHAILSGSRPPPSVQRRQHALTFRKFVRTYLEKREVHWKPSTTLANKKYLRNTLLPAFGRLPLGDVREVAVRRWFHRYGEKSPGGANRAMAMLRDIINRAIEWGALPTDARLHDLRHTFASVALMSGETMRATGELLGHRNQQSTARYAHMRSEYLHEAAEAVSARIASTMGDHLMSGAGTEPRAPLTDVRH